MKLIIAEKPSLARTVAKSLGKYEDHTETDHTGFLKIDDYIVTWCFGHLFSLNDVDDYMGKKMKWEDIPLPFIPDPFQYKPRTKNKQTDEIAVKQFKVIGNFVNSNDITEIIHCGDSDREGQTIIEIPLNVLNNKKIVKRLWLPEQTEEVIRKELRNLKNNSDYLNLSNEGFARAYLDWILGINLSVFLSVKAGEKLNVGRVLIPILKFIYDRDLKIRNFKPEDYFEIESNCTKDNINFKLVVKEKYSSTEEEKANEKASNLNSFKGIVKEINQTEKRKYPSKLFSLSKLQKFLSSKFNINFQTSMEHIQKLYENGYITYPRTSTEYLGDSEKEKVKNLISKLSNYNLEFKDSKKIFDSSKVESHSAINITTKIPTENDLMDIDKTIYTAIFNRFISNFLKEDTILSETSVKIIVNDTEFTLKGETIVNEGFLKYEPEKIENNLPNFVKDEEIDVDFKVLKKQTTIPKHITESDLESFLENPFRTEKTTEEEEYKAILEGVQIGTTATRTDTIAKAIKYNYFSRKNGSYYLEPLGERIVNNLDKLQINLYKDRTVEFSKFLKKVNKNEITIEEIIDNVKKELIEIFSKKVEIEKAPAPIKESLGTCPLCKKNIYERKTKTGKIFYSCEGYKEGCTFALWEEMKYFDNTLKITKSRAKNLIAGKKVAFKLISKNKKEYEGYLTLKINGKYINFESAGYPENKKK